MPVRKQTIFFQIELFWIRFSFSFYELMPKYQAIRKNGKVAKINYLNFDVFSNRHYSGIIVAHFSHKGTKDSKFYKKIRVFSVSPPPPPAGGGGGYGGQV